MDAAGNLSAYSNVASAATQGGQLYYIVPDHLNTPRLIANQVGTTVWRWDQAEPFGADSPNDDPNNTGNHFEFPLRLSNYYADRETGNFYAMLRDAYDPTIGRFPQSDPIGLNGGINLYAYALNNPLRYTDPLGLDVTMTCRPVSAAGAAGMSSPVHCAVFVWHYDQCGRRVIDAQYSLPFGATSPTRDPSNLTYAGDTQAFGSGPGNYPIPAPPGMSQSDWDRAVTNSGNNYSQGPYFPVPGPNSNTAAGNIITNAGGTVPNAPGAWGMGYQPFTGGSIGDIIAP
jgi:RHS repeat-associated protein